MKLYTIGFTRKSAEHFFGLLRGHRVRRLLDVRLRAQSQLSGFAKGSDLRFFSRALCDIDYVHLLALAPTAEMLDAYREDKNWPRYESAFHALLETRRVETLDRDLFDGGCLLCSEDAPDRCHRRVAAEYLQRRWPAIEIEHLT